MKNSLNNILLQIQYLPLSALKPNPKNPRKHPKKQIRQLAASIQRFGFNVPLLVNADHQVIAGHGRMLAAQELGFHELPIIRLEHLSEAEAATFLLADNKLCENADWDDQLLSQLFQELDGLDLNFDLDITGFQMNEIDLMIENVENPSNVDEEPPSEIIGPPITQIGDLWQLGKHRLLCADSLKPASFEVLMQGKKARQIFVDPPYNVRVNGHVSGLGKIQHREFAMASGEMTQEEFTQFLQQSLSLLALHSMDGAIHYICMDWRHMRELLTAGDVVYSELKNLCVWEKDNGGMGAFYRSQHELVFVFKNGTAPHVNNFELGQYGRYRTNVWNYPGAASFARQTEEGNMRGMHPTVKPVAMVADAILDCSKRGEVILDSFLGSGTTLIAAEKTGRRCYGIEIDPAYIDVAIRRWQKLAGKQAIHAESGKTYDDLAVGVGNNL